MTPCRQCQAPLIWRDVIDDYGRPVLVLWCTHCQEAKSFSDYQPLPALEPDDIQRVLDLTARDKQTRGTVN